MIISAVLLSLTTLLVIVGAVLLFWDGGYGRPAWGLPGVQVLWALGFSAVGYPITRRHPANPVGWCLMVAGAAAGVNLLGLGLGSGVTIEPGSTPDSSGSVSWLESAWVISVSALCTAAVLFPSGSPPSRLWRAQLGVLWGCGILAYVNATSTGFVAPPGWLGPLSVPVSTVFQLSLAAGCFSLLVRWRRSGPVERLQLKWVAYGVSLVGILTLATEVGVASFAPAWYFPGTVLLSMVIVIFPATMGVAMLRYRLYDVDLVINRTLVYGILTASLALVYFGSVVALQAAFRAFTGGGSQLVIVASTLAIAALFNPLRNRIQGFIDRRFYRNRYDAAKTLEAFSARLRNETDLDALSDDLVTAAGEIMRPEHISLWLRRPEGEERR